MSYFTVGDLKKLLADYPATRDRSLVDYDQKRTDGSEPSAKCFIIDPPDVNSNFD